jgi:hypothetical protein
VRLLTQTKHADSGVLKNQPPGGHATSAEPAMSMLYSHPRAKSRPHLVPYPHGFTATPLPSHCVGRRNRRHHHLRSKCGGCHLLRRSNGVDTTRATANQPALPGARLASPWARCRRRRSRDSARLRNFHRIREIRVKRNVTIEGAGTSSTTVKVSSGSKVLNYRPSPQNDNVEDGAQELRNLTLEGNNRSQTNGVYCAYRDNVKFRA